MRVVIVGVTGNAGTALARRLGREPDVTVVGVARRHPENPVDIGDRDAVDRLAGVFAGADAVVHLAWQIQPSHDQRQLYRTNVLGTRTVARAVVDAGVPTLVVAPSG